MRFMQGPVEPVGCMVDGSEKKCPLYGNCAFLPMWKRIGEAVSEVYDNTTFQDLVDQEKRRTDKRALCYFI